MQRVVPSQVATFIDQVFGWLRSGSRTGNLYREAAGHAAALIVLIDAIPQELLTLTGADYIDFVYSVAVIRQQLSVWENQQNLNLQTPAPQVSRGLNPVTLIHELLLKCPDQWPAAETAELAFISDAELRNDLRLDLSSISRALGIAEWKTATVLSGAVLEALLLWALQQQAAA